MAQIYTPKKIYLKKNICLLCGFSFVQKETDEYGKEKVIKKFHLKAKVNSDRLSKIKLVVPDFEPSTDAELNGICVSCDRKVQRVIRSTQDAETNRNALQLSRRNVVDECLLSFDSPSKCKGKSTEKRGLRSPSLPFPKQPRIYPASLKKKPSIQAMSPQKHTKSMSESSSFPLFQTMERLSQLGLCVHPVTVQRKLLTWQGELDAELLIMRDSWADGGTVKYQLIGDNWDKNILPTYRTSDRNTISLHLFNMYAVVDRIIPPPSDVFTRLADPEQLKASDFIPSGVEQATLKRELTFLFAEIIIANIESVEEVMDNCYPQHLAHEYSHMAGTKTTQFPLGIFDCNEIFTQEMVNLMTHTLDKYVPKNQGDIVEAVFLGGDRLTDERAQIAQDSVRNGSTPTKRLEGFISKIEDFHRLMNFLETVSDFSETSSISDTRHLVEEKDDGKPRSNIPMTSFNFINSIIGSGIIGMPFALRQAGFGLGIILIVVVALITDYSIFLLIEAGHLSNTDCYQDMVLVAFGRPGFYVLTVLQFLYPFIAMVSYNVIIGDTLTKVIIWFGGEEENLIHSVLGNRQFVIFLSTLLITLPLSLYRNIARLGKWAFLSILLIVFIMISVVIKLAIFAKDIPPTEGAWQFANYNITQAIGIMAFAYMCHHNTFLIHSSLENPTHQRWGFVTHFSVIFAMFMCLVLAIIGYVSFTGMTQGDLLENYCRDDVLMNIVRIAFAITIMLTYPVECFVTREVVENAVFPSNPPTPMWRHIFVTVMIVFLTAAVSMSTDCLGIVLELNGVLAAAPLAYIIPAVSVMRLRQEAMFSRGNIGPMAVALFGLLVAVIGFIMAMINLANGSTCSHGEDMPYCYTHINISSPLFPLNNSNPNLQVKL